MAGNPLGKQPGFWERQVLYPGRYTWFVFVSALDLLMTGIVLRWGGREVNCLADYVILQWGRDGLVLFKFAIVVFVIAVCEWVGRHRRKLGRQLATCAVALPAAAVAVAFIQLLAAR